jgi:hypothetical protein
MPTKENTTIRGDLALTSQDAHGVTFGGKPDVITVRLTTDAWYTLDAAQVIGFTFEADPEWAVNGNQPTPA